MIETEALFALAVVITAGLLAGRLASAARIPSMIGQIVAGIAIGVFALSLVSEERLGVLFGVLLLGAVALKAGGLHLPRSRGTLLAAGGTSGFMGPTVGVGGPPVALVLSDLSGPAFRATMSPYFLVGTTLSLAALALGGHFDLDDLVAGLWR